MIKMGADLSGIGNYIGTVGGFLEAVESPGFEGNFTEHLMRNIETNFMTETIAANMKDGSTLQHVFEWGDKMGEPSNIPLFHLTNGNIGGEGVLSYEFLPSTQYVPLPDSSKYGIDPAKIARLRRHVFQMKAVVMETMNKVTVAPVGSKKLFIPDETNKRGYYMTSNPQTINPGGIKSTGGFAEWWRLWFSNRAPDIVKEEVEQVEQFLVLTGRKYVRYAAGTRIDGVAVGGRFASGQGVSVGYINSKAKSVKAMVLSDSEKYFDVEKWESTWVGK